MPTADRLLVLTGCREPREKSCHPADKHRRENAQHGLPSMGAEHPRESPNSTCPLCELIKPLCSQIVPPIAASPMGIADRGS
jgi:hypothetical protein